jgi:metal-responsive CopG/Arc/MetJ family transcriptional regulator
MKVKTSITLSPEILAQVDCEAAAGNRSEFIEHILRHHFLMERRQQRDEPDLAILNAIADGKFDRPDILEYTTPITFEDES